MKRKLILLIASILLVPNTAYSMSYLSTFFSFFWPKPKLELKKDNSINHFAALCKRAIFAAHIENFNAKNEYNDELLNYDNLKKHEYENFIQLNSLYNTKRNHLPEPEVLEIPEIDMKITRDEFDNILNYYKKTKHIIPDTEQRAQHFNNSFEVYNRIVLKIQKTK